MYDVHLVCQFHPNTITLTATLPPEIGIRLDAVPELVLSYKVFKQCAGMMTAVPIPRQPQRAGFPLTLPLYSALTSMTQTEIFRASSGESVAARRSRNSSGPSGSFPSGGA